MPCDYELDLERKWVRARAWGVVTYDDALANRKKFTSDPGSGRISSNSMTGGR